MRKLTTTLILTSVALLLVSTATAQSPLGSIIGTVKDETGGVMPGVECTSTDKTRGYTRTDITNDAGDYEIDLLLKGFYSLTCELAGFKTVTQPTIQLDLRELKRIDLVMTIGEVTEQVTVTDAAPVVASETNELQVNSLSRKMIDLMFGDGDRMLMHLPYFGAKQSAVVTYGEASAHAAGGMGGLGSARVDGMDMLVQQTPLMPEALAEININYAGAKADVSSQLVMDGSLVSGENRPHARLAYIVRNPGLNSLGPTGGVRAGQTSTKVRHWDMSGPVYIPGVYDGRDRTFWWIGFNKSSSINPPTGRAPEVIPPPAWRAGDFSRVPATLFSSGELIDPLTGSAFPGNRIPANRIQQFANVINNDYIPAPNYGPGKDDPHYIGLNYSISVGGSPMNAFSGSSPRTENMKFDHRVTENDQVGYTLIRNGSAGGWNFDGYGLWVIEQFGRNDWNTGYWTHAFSPSTLNEIRMGTSHGVDGWGTVRDRKAFLGWAPRLNQGGFTVLKELGIDWKPDIADGTRPSNGLPKFCIGGATRFEAGQNVKLPFCATGGNEDEADINRFISHFIDNLSIRQGNHSWKMGFEAHMRNEGVQVSHAFGEFIYDGRFTGFAFGDFLLGLPGTADVAAPSPFTTTEARRFAMYLMDDWKVRPDLTLELGIRMEHHLSPRERDWKMLNFHRETGQLIVPNDFALAQVSPLFPMGSGPGQIPVVRARDVGLSQMMRKHPQPIWYPRVGIAWRPFNNARTVVRAGAGMFVAPTSGNRMGLSAARGLPYVMASILDNALNADGTTLFTQNNPAIQAVEGGVGPPPGMSVSGMNTNFPFPWQTSWNLTIEQELFPNTAGRISYLGTKVTQMPYRTDATKPVAQGLLPYRGDCSSQPAGSCVGPFYPLYARVNFSETGGNQTHHGLELEMHRRFAAGVEFMVDYYWQRTLVDVRDSSNMHGGFSQGDFIEDPRNRARDKGLSRHNVPHRLTINNIVQLPFGRGMRWDFGGNRIFDAMLGGWETLGFWTYFAPYYFSPVWGGTDWTNTNTFTLRPNAFCQGNLKEKTVDKFFRPECFAEGTPGQYGTAGVGIFEGVPASFLGTVEMGIFKTFTLADIISEEGLRFRIGAELLNPFNHPYLATRSSRNNTQVVNSPTAASTSKSGLRNIRFQLRLEF